jgi:hypothetical protein
MSVMVVDFVFEENANEENAHESTNMGMLNEEGVCSGMGGRARACYLASVYYDSNEQANHWDYACMYMKKVQEICNSGMNFFPGILVMRVSNKGVLHATVQVCDVSVPTAAPSH